MILCLQQLDGEEPPPVRPYSMHTVLQCACVAMGIVDMTDDFDKHCHPLMEATVSSLMCYPAVDGKFIHILLHISISYLLLILIYHMLSTVQTKIYKFYDDKAREHLDAIKVNRAEAQAEAGFNERFNEQRIALGKDWPILQNARTIPETRGPRRDHASRMPATGEVFNDDED